MTEGSYRSMDFGELSGAYERLADEAKLFRPLVETPEDVDPANATPPVYLAALGPDVVSTSMGLLPLSSLPIWDVNGYYRAIGVPWPYQVTRRELTRIYNDRGGPNNHDDYATYAFQRLRDPEFRRHYDRRPLGQPVDDKYRWEQLRRLAALWAAKQSAAIGRAVTVQDVLGEDITRRMEAQAEAERQAEELAAQRGEEEPVEHDDDRPCVWPFAYYLWGSRMRDDERLAQWQQLLVESFCRKGLSLQMAVGYFDRTRAAAARVRHRKPGGQHVEILFLHQDAVPSAELADVVVGTYHNRPYGTPLEHPLYLHHR